MVKFAKGKEQPDEAIHSLPGAKRKTGAPKKLKTFRGDSTAGLSRKRRIGIFPGTFDPVHAGHLSFALQSFKEAGLDQVVFLPERQPRGKLGVEHFGHRTAMLTRAIKPYKNFSILELPDIYFDVPRTLPKLQKEFAGAELVFLMGSDTLLRMNFNNWPEKDLATFLSQTGLLIGLRSEHNRAEIKSVLGDLPKQPKSYQILSVPANHVSSSRIRQAFRHNLPASGLLASVLRYAKAEWLYTLLPPD